MLCGEQDPGLWTDQTGFELARPAPDLQPIIPVSQSTIVKGERLVRAMGIRWSNADQ